MSTEILLAVSGINVVALFTVVWRGGTLLGSFTTAMTNLTEEVAKLRQRREEDAVIMARVVEQVDQLERRVEHLEARADRRVR